MLLNVARVSVHVFMEPTQQLFCPCRNKKAEGFPRSEPATWSAEVVAAALINTSDWLRPTRFIPSKSFENYRHMNEHECSRKRSCLNWLKK